MEKDTILYVDDNLLNLELFRESFSSEYNIILSESGEEALKIYTDSKIDLVVADLMMPEMSGIEFLEKIIEINPFPSRIIMTAYGDLESAKEAVNRCKIFYYIQKPWYKKELSLIIKHAINAYKQEARNRQLTEELCEKTKLLEEELKKNQEILSDLQISDNKLKINEQHLQNLINSAGTVIILVSDNGIISEWNLEAEKYFKLTKEQAVGNKYSEVITSDGLVSYFSQAINDYSNNKILENQEVSFTGRDGIAYSFLWNISPLFNIISKSVSFIFTGQNIDVIKQAQNSLKSSEERYKLLAENVSDVIWLLDINGKLLYVSPSIQKLQGYTPEEAIQINVIDTLTPASRMMMEQLLGDFLQKINQGIIDDKPETYEVEQVCKDGSIIWTETNVNKLFDENKQFKCFLGVSRDITDRVKAEEKLKFSEEKFSAIFTYTPESILLTEFESGKVIIANKHFFQVMGLSQEEILNHTTLDIGFWEHPDQRESFTSSIKKFGEVTNYEVTYNSSKSRMQIGLISAKLIYIDDVGYILGIIVNITERKKLEEQLLNSEQLFKAIIEQTAEGIVLLNMDGSIVLSNNAFVQLSKFTMDELLSMKLEQLIEEDANPPILELIKKKNVGKREVQFVDKEKNKFFIEIKGNIIYIGKKEHILVIINNIHEKYLAEIALRRSEARLREAQKIAHIGHYYIDYQDKKIEWSDEMYRIFGLGKDAELVFDKIYDFIHKDDFETVLSRHQEAVKKKSRFSSEHRIIRDKNEIRYVSENARIVLDDKGNPKRGIGTVQDITELKKAENEIRKLNENLEQRIQIRTKEYQESEEKFRILLKYIPDGFLLIDKHQKIILANRQAEKLFGYTTSQFINCPLDILIPERYIDKHSHLVDNFYNNPHDREMETGKLFPAIRKNGEEFPADIRLGTVIIKNETYIICIIRDITEKKIAEDELKKAKIDAEAANRTKSEFLANMSHEIRTPLNAVLGITDLLFQQITDNVQRNYLETIKSSSKTLLTLIDDILDLSKIEAGKLKLNYSYINLNNIIDEVVSIFIIRVKEKGIQILTEINKNIPPLIYIDEIRLRQVLLNLVSNAVKFTKTGHVKIVAERVKDNTKENKPNQLDILISVEDTGIGIKKTFLDSIFNTFTQQEDLDTRKYGGAGLGLAITNRLVRLMNGKISVQSKLNQGSIFTVTLHEIKYSETRTFQTKTIEKPVEIQNFLPCKIVIADDNPDNIKYLQGVFYRTNIEVYTAANGIEAYNLVEQHKPDMLITDILMPKLDGFKLSEKIKSNPELINIPIIANSAAVMSLDKHTLDHAFFDVFISKPVEINKLLLVLKKYLPYRTTQTEKDNNDLDKPSEIQKIKQEVVQDIRNQTFAQWEKIQSKQKIEHMVIFYRMVNELGEKYKINALTDFSNELKSAIDSFSIDTLIRLINHYPKLLDMLELNKE